MIALLIAAIWVLVLVLWVGLKLRQPKWDHPCPPEDGLTGALRGEAA